MEKELEGCRVKGCGKSMEGQDRDGRKEESALFYMYLCITVTVSIELG